MWKYWKVSHDTILRKGITVDYKMLAMLCLYLWTIRMYMD